jgi:hypothetical protein
MSNSGSRLYLTCRIFRRAASSDRPRIKIQKLGLRRARCTKSQLPLTIRCKRRAKVIWQLFAGQIPFCRGFTAPPRQSPGQFGFPDAAPILRRPDSPMPKLLFPRWSRLANFPERFEERGPAGASVLVFERADSHEGDRSHRDANSEGPVAIGHGRNQEHPNPLQCRSLPEASQPFSD